MAQTAYWVIYPASGTEPANNSTGGGYIKDGKDGAGVTATASGSEAFSATSGTGDITEATAVTTLTSGVAYKVSWVIYDDVAATYSNVTTGSFGTRQTISPSLVTNTSTVYTPTVLAGAVTVTPSVVTNTSNVYTPTLVAGAVTVTPSLVTNTSTVYTPTVLAGAITATPNLIENTSTVYTPTVFPAGVIAPGLITNTSTVYTPTVLAGAVTATPGLVTNTSNVYTPTVTAGAVTATPGLIDNTSTVYTPTVTAGAVTITPGLITNTSNVYTPNVVVAGLQTITPGLITNNNIVYPPVVGTAGNRYGGPARKPAPKPRKPRKEYAIENLYYEQYLKDLEQIVYTDTLDTKTEKLVTKVIDAVEAQMELQSLEATNKALQTILKAKQAADSVALLDIKQRLTTILNRIEENLDDDEETMLLLEMSD